MSRDPAGVGHVLASFARDLLNEDSVQTTLTGITALAAAEIEGVEHAGVSLVRANGAITSVATTDPMVERIDRVQYETRQGPCLQAIWTRAVFTIDDIAEEQRWPDFVAEVQGLGMRSMLSFQLFTHQETLGALNLYSGTPHAFVPDSYETGALLAAHAAVALASAQREENLEIGLRSRQRIGEATGIVMERFKVTDRQAFAILAQISQNNNVKLRDLAEEIVLTGAVTEGTSGPTKPGPESDEQAPRLQA